MNKSRRKRLEEAQTLMDQAKSIIEECQGEEQDAYVLGVGEPVAEFTGRVVAIIHRFDDIEEKWVVAPDGASFTKDEIMRKVAFQEQFFHTEIRMS